ncbi:MAG: AI-2E family transporter [Anaerolineae bacterium]|jgi:predicted PurR-regulated permease PerM
MSEGTIDSVNLRERLFFYIVFAILILLTILMMQPFFTALVVSLISVILLKPVYNYFFARPWVRERKTLAASLTLIALFLILVVPVFLIVVVSVNQLSNLFSQLAALDLEAVFESIRQTLERLPLVSGLEPSAAEAAGGVSPLLRAVAQAVTDFALSLGASIPSMFVQGIIFIVVVASLLPVYDTLLPRMEQISPLGPELSELYTRKITAMVRSLVFGVFLVAVIQGAAMGIFFWVAGLPYIFLLTILSMVLALIPMVGISWLVIAVAIFSFLTGNWLQALVVLFGFYGVVNWIDLLLRPRLLAEEASINFALFILAILGGLAWAGVMGLFYGPVLMLLLVTTVEIYAERYAHEDRGLLSEALDRLGEARGPTPDETGTGAEGTDAADSEGNTPAVEV